MRRDLLNAIRLLALPTVALIVVVGLVPGRLPLVVRVYALVVCAIALGFGVVWLHRAYPPTPPLRARHGRARPGRARPTVLDRLENEVVLGVANAFDLHRRLVPRLWALAGELLASRRGVSLERRPDDARAVLGEETWEVLRPDRPPPHDRRARGIPPEALSKVTGSLEAI